MNKQNHAQIISVSKLCFTIPLGDMESSKNSKSQISVYISFCLYLINCCCYCVPILVTTFPSNFSGKDPWPQYGAPCIHPDYLINFECYLFLYYINFGCCMFLLLCHFLVLPVLGLKDRDRTL